ncbi:Gfo/Idh/MocA family protein [Consotaella salsifontis]|uniref:Predicted dehydrogenase n=1 Tax=Consotaella salsifontis TaxID=1365950 RepID=A0A1T4QQY5_9HYPH|nr:Gfo/Idh/MocA family oxidoreductase [Consotaella salsifontis]SKA06183.1 Predicted dehydrogenase [Consotaella salsifontis]
MSQTPIKVLVAGLGNMGASHARAYHTDPGYEIVGLVTRGGRPLPTEFAAYPHFTDFHEALATTKPDLASINTYTDTHVPYAIAAMEAGAHVFVEKPLATTVEDARRVVDTAARLKRKLVVGYILRHHPSWMLFIEKARELGGPFVMRLNLNQQSFGEQWALHKTLMETTSPMVDCGVHYVDVMCQITDARPKEVRGMGVRLTDEIAPDQFNYTHLQVLFDDGSVGWYEAAWGPMISETAFFVKDVMTPKGSVSIVVEDGSKSSDIDTHTKTSRIRVHHGALSADGRFARDDDWLSTVDEPGHDALCAREQAFMAKAIREDLDLSRHNEDAVRSLAIVLAADRSAHEGRPIALEF